MQKGLAPALCYQFVMNGARLGTYQIAEKQGWTSRKNGQGVDPLKSLTAGALSGVIGAMLGSPFYLVRTKIRLSFKVKCMNADEKSKLRFY